MGRILRGAFWSVLLLLFLGLAVGAVVGGMVIRERLQNLSFATPVPRQPGEEVFFEVRPGETTGEIAQRLYEEGLIRSPFLFQLRARLTGADRQLQAGTYRLRAGMTDGELLEALQHSPVEERTVTVPEGWRREEIAELLAREGLVPSPEAFLEAAVVGEAYADFEFLADLEPGTPLEGYLFPDTYRIPVGYAPEQIVRLFLTNFERRVWTREVRDQLQASGRTLQEVVILASLVEREAVVDEERPLIAGVFYNRLELGMPLQTDPTVQYALGYQPDEGTWWKTELTFDDLKVESPYNTYLHPGLPPGPICNPGLASIQAALNPAETDYLYFVAKTDGSGEHLFARTLEEHNENIRKVGR